jgi:exosome complex component RRP42
MSNVEIIWELTSDKVENFLKEGKRLDKRAFDEYRKIEIETDISKNADGSSRVRLGGTEVVCGIKADLGEPYPDSPDEGAISVGMELLPLASPSYESGPPSEESIEIARVVDRGIRESKAMDFKKLCITEGEKVLMVFIDLYAMNDNGNMFDASSIASMAALLNARLPKVEDGKIVKGEYDAKFTELFKDLVKKKPLLSTFAKINGAIVLDPVLAEEKAMNARFSVATTEDDYLTAFQKGHGGSFSLAEIDNCLDVALKKSKEIRKLF